MNADGLFRASTRWAFGGLLAMGGAMAGAVGQAEVTSVAAALASGVSKPEIA